MKLKGKSIIVTGGSRGIGAAIAKRLAEDGARIALTYTSKPEAAEEVRKSLPGEGHLALQINIANEDSVEAGLKVVLEQFDKIDGLVNNAGITKDQLLLRMKAEDFDQVIQTNLRGTYLCTRAVSKVMLKARQGSIVNITSVIGHSGNPGQANYAASKGGITAFSKSIAQEIGSRNIRINCVAPGFIVTEMTDVLPETQKNAILAKIPLQKFGNTEDIAAAVSFLLSDDAVYITGQTLHVNGGMSMY
ncbi:MAG: 3-oxoacyl-[acyl-carrier-protein] reductase [Bdellovibrionales bacterium RBG_16_40_8]|nr:MAG: 3-oxoacyl-[acyl-carrier-protein] reductase [Bdellovibrionales bacterium RBG_16_40_8]